jgi:hypothetical protein
MASTSHQLVNLPALAVQFIRSPTRAHHSRTLVVPNANVAANSSRVGTIRPVGRPMDSSGSHRGSLGDLSDRSSCRSYDLQILCRRLALVGYFFVLDGLPLIEGA